MDRGADIAIGTGDELALEYLVTDLYQRGAADIIQLVDAQNQALGAALAAANALYDFLIDALRVQRASGSFSLEGSQEVRDDFLQRQGRSEPTIRHEFLCADGQFLAHGSVGRNIRVDGCRMWLRVRHCYMVGAEV